MVFMVTIATCVSLVSMTSLVIIYIAPLINPVVFWINHIFTVMLLYLVTRVDYVSWQIWLHNLGNHRSKEIELLAQLILLLDGYEQPLIEGKDNVNLEFFSLYVYLISCGSVYIWKYSRNIQQQRLQWCDMVCVASLTFTWWSRDLFVISRGILQLGELSW